jgi:fatty aldehyde-generating acyl-ACP reductase
MSRKKFAFLFHARSSFQAEAALLWRPLRHVPEMIYERAVQKFSLPPIQFAKVFLPDAPRDPAGWILILPTSSRQMLKDPREARAKVNAAVEYAIQLGAGVVGLGALTSPVTRGGTTLADRKDIAVTNGNAYTAAATYQAAARLLRQTGVANPSVALIGATGSVGSCVAKLLARRRVASRFTLVARTRGPLEELATELRGYDANIQADVATDMQAVRSADLVVLLTSAADTILRAEHLKRGAIVLDDTQPRNTDPRLQAARPDVRIVDGGLVSVPGINISNSIGLPHGCIYACLAETMLLAIDGHEGHFSLGNASVEQAEHTMRLADKHRALGFHLAPLRSFGRRLGVDVRTTGERRYAA